MGSKMRPVKIIATLGPATRTPERIRDLMTAGASVFRLNLSHGSQEEHAEKLTAVRSIAGELGRHAAVLLDLQGPKIRVLGVSEDTPLELVTGQKLLVSSRPIYGKPDTISTNYPRLHEVVSRGGRILLDDGRMELLVTDIVGDLLHCRVVNGGLLESNKGVNLPGAPLDIPAFTDKDAADLEFGLGLGVDWIALSFVRHAEDIRPLRAAVEKHGTKTPILAKIERPEALANLNAILRAFDGVMVARGDLGIELPPEEVPTWQKTIIRQARNQGKVSIVATQMLESMIGNPRPTRAEVSDVANAVLDGADAVMLSGETSVGSYPAECVTIMAHIIEQAQAICSPCETGEKERTNSAGAVAHAACVLARELRCKALIVLTRSGMTAHSVSIRRPALPVIAFTDRPAMARQLSLWWGITPMVLDFPVHTDDAFRRMEEALVRAREVNPGDNVVVVGATPLTVRGPTNFLKVHKIGRGM